ncbi:MAG: ribonuclease H-like domain-containing protein [Acidobacteriota bacterium]
MRDLAARLREVVRRERAAEPPPAARELTYIPDPDPQRVAEGAASALGGVALDPGGACIVVDRRYPADRSHGRRSIESCAPRGVAPLHLLDERTLAHADWSRRVVFFDIETTGLSGGAGTLAFLAGCGWFEESGDFTVRQFFLVGPSGERPMLEALGRIFDEASMLVTYNGRTFDVPFMETRWAFHRREAPTGDLAHFDMLPPARRLWSRREMMTPDDEGCSLGALERRVLGFHRSGDVPGFEIPGRYFQFLRTGDPSLVEGVLDHNRHDLVSLAAVMAHALWLAEEGPHACREPAEQAALGRLYERAQLLDRAIEAYELADATGDAEVKRHALARLAVLHRRASRYGEAAIAWQRIVDLVPRGRRTLTSLERRAVEALAIHHEHRAKDLSSARRFAEALGASSTGRQETARARRLQRLERKMSGRLLE